MMPKKHPRTIREDREFDTTQLKSSYHGKIVHRDYAAHWFRWGFASNYSDRNSEILDIGCGQELSFVMILTGALSSVPKRMVAVDLNNIRKPPTRTWLTVRDKFNFIEQWDELQGPFSLITCFEMIEHMDKENGLKLLKAAKRLLSKNGVMLLSTPVYNNKHMAANHIHEYGYDELKEHIEKAGFTVDRTFGMFMTSHAMKKVCTPEELKLVEQLHRFYSYDVLANFLAPKYPRHASNCVCGN